MLELWLKHQQGDFRLEVDLKTAPGITALFGPSGSGKTSVINMVAGLNKPQEGRIVIDQRVLFDSKQQLNLPPEKRRLGYVFQDARLFPHLTVKDNLHFGMKLAPVSERKIDFAEVIELLGIGHLLDRRPAKLSGGEKQRVAIGRALLASPRILLMDEPLASLDAKRKTELLPFIRDLAQHFRLPILYVSHAMEEILALADNLILLENGRTIAAGMVEDVFAHTAWQGEIIGVIKAEIVAHDLQYGISSLSFSGGILQIALADLPLGTKVRLRIQAKDVALALSQPTRISVRNAIPCRVVELTREDNYKVNVRLDCKGTVIWSEITALAQAELGLKPGTDVFALIKAVRLAKIEKAFL